LFQEGWCSFSRKDAKGIVSPGGGWVLFRSPEAVEGNCLEPQQTSMVVLRRTEGAGLGPGPSRISQFVVEQAQALRLECGAALR
jgi:hypothetical protein